MIKCDPRASARCPFKKRCCGDDVAYFVEGSECDEFNKQVLARQPTNADRVRAMSDEELAWELMLWRCEAVAKHHGVSSEYPDTQKTILKWLQQPAEEG